MHDEREALPAPAAGERLSIYALPENTAHESGHTAADYTLSAAAQQRIADGVPANTRGAYARQWALFTAWCTAHGRIRGWGTDGQPLSVRSIMELRKIGTLAFVTG
ncbi:hypothetical protein GBF35_24265 [Nonomuraea phyllanthi]|uniref:hypothetical protein n=1 Tax=Nonomuraea phyllanthi TaxID=2219224 RepID=UPI0012934370|nr:hypothetical protein [Nonomuraea phyllanthi]QFY09346.1 hypothetical protein GBF35_24265 [Nonomuraea phyllanthi]